MRIDNTPQPIKPNVPAQDAKSASAAQSAAGSASDRSLASVDLQNIDGLLHLIVSANDIRESLVNEVRAKLQAGEYAAKQSAVETASSILNL